MLISMVSCCARVLMKRGCLPMPLMHVITHPRSSFERPMALPLWACSCVQIEMEIRSRQVRLLPMETSLRCIGMRWMMAVES